MATRREGDDWPHHIIGLWVWHLSQFKGGGVMSCCTPACIDCTQVVFGEHNPKVQITHAASKACIGGVVVACPLWYCIISLNLSWYVTCDNVYQRFYSSAAHVPGSPFDVAEYQIIMIIAYQYLHCRALSTLLKTPSFFCSLKALGNSAKLLYPHSLKYFVSWACDV